MLNILKKLHISYSERKNSVKRGFTIIEVLTVIGIMAILGVAIVPTVTGARDKAVKARYLSDCKMIISAVESYNATCIEADVIKDDTAITVLQTKLTNASDKFLKSWPKEFPKVNNTALSSYSDIVTYVNNFSNTTTTQQASNNNNP